MTTNQGGGIESMRNMLRRAPRWLKMMTLILAICGALFSALIGWALYKAWRPLGKMATGARLARMTKAKQWDGDKFRDIMPRVEPQILKILPAWLEKPHPNRRPTDPLAHKNPTRAAFALPPETGLRITWLGHSTLIVEIAGKRILIDPVWGDYVAPLPLKNAKRFIPPPLPFEELPPLDAVVISHDHYDHLDFPTIVRLAKTDVPFYVPLGVGSHLEYWGVSPERIHEHEWWEESRLGELTIACTPARHFSGRSFVDKDKTLWASWAFIGPDARAYFSGDTALFPEFREIGERYGPFDATMMENGAYNQMWADVHLGPEQAIKAHKMVKGGLLIPVHWSMFDLGLHGWTEPMERILIAAKKEGVEVATLMPGESIEPKAAPKSKRWWPSYPFDTFEEKPIVSSHLPEELR